MLASIDSTNHRAAKSRCTSDNKRVHAIVTISRLIGCCWTLDGEGIKIQSNKADIWKESQIHFFECGVIWRLLTIATFSDGISQRCCVAIRRGIGRVLNIRAILTDIACGRKYEDTTDTKSSCAVSQSSAAFVWTFRWSEACTIPATIWRRATIVFESHHIEEWENWNENNWKLLRCPK